MKFRIALATYATLAIVAWGSLALGQQGRCLQEEEIDGKMVCTAREKVVVSLPLVPLKLTAVLQDQGEVNADVDWILDGKKQRVCSKEKPCNTKIAPRGQEIPLVISLPGYQDREVTLAKTPAPNGGNAFVAKVGLARCPRVELPSLPEGTDVETRVVVDDTLIGFWPSSFQSSSLEKTIAQKLNLAAERGCALPRGRYFFELQHSTYRPIEEWVDLELDQSHKISGDMQRRTGTLVVHSVVGGVDLVVDGKVRGRFAHSTAESVIELSNIDIGKYTVELKVPDDLALPVSEREFWGDFPRQRSDVAIEDGSVATVVFSTPTAPTRPNPATWTARRDFLDELCENDASACLAAGWARRFGVGGEIDLSGAAQGFKRACEDPWGTTFTRNSKQVEDVMREARGKLQACTAYAWLVQTGLVSPEASGTPSFVCASSGLFAADPVSPCLRAHLSSEAQASNDPTPYVDHEVLTTPSGLPLFLTVDAGFADADPSLGLLKRELSVGYGFFIGQSWFTFDALVTGGAIQFKRWNAAFSEKEWRTGWGLAYELGPSFRILPHLFLGAHFKLGFAHLPNAEALSFRYGGRAALIYSSGALLRSKLSLELGVTWEKFNQDMLNPSDGEILDRVRKTGDISVASRAHATPSRLLSPNFSVGYIF
jgi:hypothetical protein